MTLFKSISLFIFFALSANFASASNDFCTLDKSSQKYVDLLQVQLENSMKNALSNIEYDESTFKVSVNLEQQDSSGFVISIAGDVTTKKGNHLALGFRHYIIGSSEYIYLEGLKFKVTALEKEVLYDNEGEIIGEQCSLDEVDLKSYIPSDYSPTQHPFVLTMGALINTKTGKDLSAVYPPTRWTR